MIQLPKWTLAVGVVLSLLPAAGRAQIVFFDDFESFRLLKSTPPGKWSTIDTMGASTLTIDTAARHRGDAGLHGVDTDGTGASGWALDLEVTLPGAPLAPGDMYLRYWMRLTGSADAGSQFMLGMIGGLLLDGGTLSPGGGAAMADVKMKFPQTLLYAAGYDRSGGYSGDPSDAGLTFGDWHLVEDAVLNFGKDGGVRALWLDRALVSATARPFNEILVWWIGVGETITDFGTFTGVVDVDDVRASRTPPASGVQLSAGVSNVDAGDCVPISISLLDSSGLAAAAPYDVTVWLGATGDAGTFFVDTACTTAPAPWLIVDAGATGRAGGFVPAGGGTVALNAGAEDFISLPPSSITVGPGSGGTDGGSLGPGPLSLLVGCGCNAPGVALGWLTLVVLGLATRRRIRV